MRGAWAEGTKGKTVGIKDVCRGRSVLSLSTVAVMVALAASGCSPADAPAAAPEPSRSASNSATSSPAPTGAPTDPSAAPSRTGESDAEPSAEPAVVSDPEGPSLGGVDVPAQWPSVPRGFHSFIPVAQPPVGAPAVVPMTTAPGTAPSPAPPVACTVAAFVPAPAPEYGTPVTALVLDYVPSFDLNAPEGLGARAAVEWWAANGHPHTAEAARQALDVAAGAPDDAARDAQYQTFLTGSLPGLKVLDDRIAGYMALAAGNPRVSQAGQAPLASSDPAVLAEFLRRGQYVAEVQGIAEVGRGAVVTGANRALAVGTREALLDFLRAGALLAQEANDRQSVYALLATGPSPSVYDAAQAALGADSPLVVAEFLRAGQHAAAAQDACQ